MNRKQHGRAWVAGVEIERYRAAVERQRSSGRPRYTAGEHGTGYAVFDAVPRYSMEWLEPIRLPDYIERYESMSEAEARAKALNGEEQTSV